MQLNESLAHKGNFKDIIQWMIKRAIEEGDKPKPVAGDACCGGGPATPDSYVSDQFPRLCECLLDILSQEPFNGKNETQIGEGKKFSYKGQLILTTILDFSRRVKGTKLLEKRNIVINPPASKSAK